MLRKLTTRFEIKVNWLSAFCGPFLRTQRKEITPPQKPFSLPFVGPLPSLRVGAQVLGCDGWRLGSQIDHHHWPGCPEYALSLTSPSTLSILPHHSKGPFEIHGPPSTKSQSIFSYSPEYSTPLLALTQALANLPCEGQRSTYFRHQGPYCLLHLLHT